MGQRGRPPHPDVLTPREWEVAALVTEGLTNGEIAERLDITERTAKFHVSEILGKLGLASREDIAAWNEDHRPARWGRALALGAMGAAAAACLAVVALLVIGTARTTGDTSVLEIRPGDVLHYEMRWTQNERIGAVHPEVSETWVLVGDGLNQAEARVFAYNTDGRRTQDGWTDAELKVTSNNGRQFERPAFQSVFMWEDETTVEDDMLRASYPPGVTPAPGAVPFTLAGTREVAGASVRDYTRSVPTSPDSEWPFSVPGMMITHVFISDEPFGLDFGETRHYVDAEGEQHLVFERRMLSFEVIDREQAPPGIFQFD